MIQVVLCGHGRMGKLIEASILACENMEIALVVDEHNIQDLAYLSTSIDLFIDFSNPAMFSVVYDFVQKNKCALLIGTTGYDKTQLEQIHQLAKEVAVMHSANYSLGVAVFQQLLQQITPILECDFDMEIIESHHNQKVDAPSGTAKLLLDAMDPLHCYQEVNGRNGNVGKRGKEIGVHAIRGGTLAGEHTVLFLGEDEQLEIKHTATSRQIFVNGAIHAAKWIVTKEAGLYTMQDVVCK